MRIVISIICFLIALGVLVTIHECGHFIAAKSFNVYCEDFSIGFGPKIFRVGRKGEEKKSALFFIKSKKNETAFSIGLVPLGGYVAMLGEKNDEKALKNPELQGRGLNDKPFWQRLIIAFGGIFMNFVLAFLVFFISTACFIQYDNFGFNVFSINKRETFDSAITLDYEGKNKLDIQAEHYEIVDDNPQTFYMVDVTDLTIDRVNYTNMMNNVRYPVKIKGKSSDYSIIFNTETASLNDIDYSNCLSIVVAQKMKVKASSGDLIDVYVPQIENNKYVYYNLKAGDEIEPIAINIVKVQAVKDSYEFSDVINCYLHLKVGSDNKLEKLGFGMFINEHRYTFKQSIKQAGKLWVDSTSLIGRTLISLFYDKNTWGQIGGPVAMFTQTNAIFNNYPFYYYLRTWGMISVNLALFNLFPFPGLDGWVILVTLIEGAVNGIKQGKNKTKKKKVIKKDDGFKEVEVGGTEEKNNEEWKIPPKVKNIISAIGLVLIFALMAVVFIKDIVGLI